MVEPGTHTTRCLLPARKYGDPSLASSFPTISPFKVFGHDAPGRRRALQGGEVDDLVAGVGQVGLRQRGLRGGRVLRVRVEGLDRARLSAPGYGGRERGARVRAAWNY